MHIDVYCTGTEMESSSSSETESKSASTPQTVFESEKVHVTHQRSDKDLPQRLREALALKNIQKSEEKRSEKAVPDNYESDGDTSTAYPSQMSSCSHIRDFGSSLSSVPPSWSSYSMSSCAVPDTDYDSIANTSWKDTISDFDSLAHSRSSVAPTESLLFVPRRFSQTTESIDECPEMQYYEKENENASKVSINPSDSFEYANSEDRSRILKMEQQWGSTKAWKSPQIERKHQMQRKLKEYLDKRLKELPKWESKETESEESDGSETGWTFVKDDDKKLERDTTVRRASTDAAKSVPTNVIDINTKNNVNPQKYSGNMNIYNKPAGTTAVGYDPTGSTAVKPFETYNIPIQESVTCKSPSVVALTQRLSQNPNLRAPFTIVPGIYTDQRQIAKKFGPIVDVFKKPGHHIGPVKNPDCLCAHCQGYFSRIGYRNRARSVGESPNPVAFNWKNLKANQSARNIPEMLPCTDY